MNKYFIFLFAGLAVALRLRKSYLTKALLADSVIKSAGKPDNGSLEQDGSKLQDYRLCTPRAFPMGILSPEKCIVVVIVIILQSRRKPTELICAEGSSSEFDMASIQDITEKMGLPIKGWIKRKNTSPGNKLNFYFG